MKISFDLNISLDKEKKAESAADVVAESTKSSDTQAETTSKAIAASSEEASQIKPADSVKTDEKVTESVQSVPEDEEKKAPSKLDKVINVAKDGKDLYDNGKEALEMISSIKMRGIIATACIVLSILLIIITPIFCHYWPQYQLKNRAENTADEARDKAINVFEDGKKMAAEKKDELAPKLDEVKDELGVKLDSAKAQAADTIDNAEKALDAKLDSAKKWLIGDDTTQANEPEKGEK